jgi:hypothetical protein
MNTFRIVPTSGLWFKIQTKCYFLWIPFWRDVNDLTYPSVERAREAVKHLQASQRQLARHNSQKPIIVEPEEEV